MGDRTPCDDHDEWYARCAYCRGHFGGTRKTDSHHSNGTAVCFIGFPGAGKTTAAELAKDVMDTPVMMSTGDLVREMAADYHDTSLDELTGEEIGMFSTMKRETDGSTYVAQAVSRRLKDTEEWPEHPLVLEGPRDKEAASFYDALFGEFYVILVHAPFEERLRRLRDRGREGDEAEMQTADLMDREQRELDWGMDEFPGEADAVIMNTGTEDDLEHKIHDTLKELSE